MQSTEAKAEFGRTFDVSDQSNDTVSVNSAIDNLPTLAGRDIAIEGVLCFEFEGTAIDHFPKAERREPHDIGPIYSSSVWLSVGDGALRRIGGAHYCHIVDRNRTHRDWEQFRNEWRVGMTEATAAAGMTLAPTDAALAPASEPSTLVAVNINDYRYVTRGARVAAGIMTGNAYIDADILFAELPAATPMGTRKYATTSSAMQGVFAPMTENQIRSICDEIVKDMARR